MPSLLFVVLNDVIFEVSRKYLGQQDGGKSELKDALEKKGFSLSEAETVIYEVNYVINKLNLNISAEEREKIILKFKPYKVIDFIKTNKRFFIVEYLYYSPLVILGEILRIYWINKEFSYVLLLIPLIVIINNTYANYKMLSGDLSKSRGKKLKNVLLREMISMDGLLD